MSLVSSDRYVTLPPPHTPPRPRPLSTSGRQRTQINNMNLAFYDHGRKPTGLVRGYLCPHKTRFLENRDIGNKYIAPGVQTKEQCGLKVEPMSLEPAVP